MGIWNLRGVWDTGAPTPARLARFAEAVAQYGDPRAVIDAVGHRTPLAQVQVAQPNAVYAPDLQDAVSF
jgi:hypothetical protein